MAMSNLKFGLLCCLCSFAVFSAIIARTPDQAVGGNVGVPVADESPAQRPAERKATALDVLEKEMDQIHNGTLPREQAIELINSQMAAGAEDAARAPGDDVVMAARIGTTPDVVQRMRKRFRETGVSSVGFDQLLYGIARQMNEDNPP